MTPPPRDRRAALLESTTLNGIDFVEVVNRQQTHLRVHFLKPTPTLAGEIESATITGGDSIPAVEVHAIQSTDWHTDGAGRPTLDLFVDAPGDFSTYRLTLVQRNPVLDRYFDHVAFSFKAGCPSTLDCEPPPHECPPNRDAPPPIDYLAKDFDSFKRALLEFSALRYPAWQERSEADFGVMFAEALSSIADDLSYQQDRIAAEGWIETATERRSLVRLARLVDYEPRVPTAARVLLQFSMDASAVIPPGTGVSALAPDGSTVEFETGTHLGDTTGTQVHPEWNTIAPWWFDDADRCLPRGATEMWIVRPGRDVVVDQTLLIETARESTADAPVRQLVTLVKVTPEIDTLYGQALLRIEWRDEDALRVEHDLTRTTLAGNLVPATQGARQVERFVIREAPSPVPGPPRAIVRTGANGSPQFLYSLDGVPLAWLAQEDPEEAPRPEIELVETSHGERDRWDWRRSLLGTTPFDQLFTLDPMRYRVVDDEVDCFEYDGDSGDTIRFGDGVQSSLPEFGMDFEVTYRVGGGIRGNVAAGAITRIEPAARALLGIASVTNPFAAEGGRDEEPDAHVRERAPQKFRAKPLRVVRTDDYERAAESLGWVQRAGTRFRWTGSWLSVFTAVDPRGTEKLADERALELTELLDRRRLAGYESFVLPPRFASLDLEITICAEPEAFRGDVEEAVYKALDSATHVDGTTGFFHADRFTFGDPLERSALEAAVQDVHGVDGVVDVRYRRRGYTRGFVRMPDAIEISVAEIIRVDNDPDHPERGSIRIDVRGGK